MEPAESDEHETRVKSDVPIEPGYDPKYFGYYAMFNNQQNMLQDIARTDAYYYALSSNAFLHVKDKVVLDCGTGSGILAYLCALFGAKRVYAVEAAPEMAQQAQRLMIANRVDHIVQVLTGKMEDVILPEQVDCLVSEPIGVMLVHERMLETFLVARNTWLKESSDAIYPKNGQLFMAPFSDHALYAETMSRARFWQQTYYYGYDLTTCAAAAMRQYLSQPVIGPIDPSCLIGPGEFVHAINFNDRKQCTLDSLYRFTTKLNVSSSPMTCLIHGIAGWFDLTFGPDNGTCVMLQTSPHCERTHWQQLRFLLPKPLAINSGQSISFVFHWQVNASRSYNVTLESVSLDGKPLLNYPKMVYRIQDQTYWYNSTTPTETLKPAAVFRNPASQWERVNVGPYGQGAQQVFQAQPNQWLEYRNMYDDTLNLEDV